MSDTRALLNRISAFRERLESTPPLTPAHGSGGLPNAIPDRTTALSTRPEWLSHSLRQLAGPDTSDAPAAPQLTARARRLLEDARELVAAQKAITDNPTMAVLAAPRPTLPNRPSPEPDPIVSYHRATVAITETALRLVQSFPTSAETQIRLCDGLEAMLRTVRERLGVATQVLARRTVELDRIDRLSRFLAALANGQPVPLKSFATLADEIIEDARRGLPIRFLTEDPGAVGGPAERPNAPAPARFVAACSLTVAQVAARIAPHDYEWAGRPLVPVVAALLMDVGMLKVPGTVLATPNALTADEYRLVERHPAVGADLIRRLIPETGPLADAIAAHHERLDGTGYPNAQSGDDIPTLARLLAVCDCYAAAASDRPHRVGGDTRDVFTDILMAAEQGRLDPDFAEYLVHFSVHPVGTVVELTDGRVGLVVAIHPDRVNLRTTSRPVVAVLVNEQGEPLARPDYVDLAAAARGAVLRAVPTDERRRLLAKHYPDLCG